MGVQDKITDLDVDPALKIDVDGSIELPNYNFSEKTFTVTDVEPGKEYELSFTITPVLDWEEAQVKLPESVTNGYSDEISVGINKKLI